MRIRASIATLAVRASISVIWSQQPSGSELGRSPEFSNPVFVRTVLSQDGEHSDETIAAFCATHRPVRGTGFGLRVLEIGNLSAVSLLRGLGPIGREPNVALFQAEFEAARTRYVRGGRCTLTPSDGVLEYRDGLRYLQIVLYGNNPLLIETIDHKCRIIHLLSPA